MEICTFRRNNRKRRLVKMPDVTFPAKIRVSERTGKKGSTNYYRIRISQDVAEVLRFIYGEPLHDYEEVQVTISKFRSRVRRGKH